MPATKLGIIEAAVTIPLLWGLMLRKKPHINYVTISHPYILISLGLTVYFGVHFYTRWTSISFLKRIAQSLGVHVSLPVTIALVCLGIFSIYATSGVSRQLYLAFSRKDTSKPASNGIRICVLAACSTTIISQLAIEVFAFSMGMIRFALGSIIVLTLILFFACVCHSIKFSIVFTSLFFVVLSVANAYVYSFRRRLIEPTDIFSFGTAMNVADNYSLFPIPVGALIAIAGWGILIFCVFKFCSRTEPAFNLKNKLIILAFCIIAAVSSLWISSDIKTYHYQKQGAVNYGYVLDFTTKIKEFFVPKPEGYSEEKIDELEGKYELTEGTEETRRPHIIVIMNEAFSDLGVYGEIETSEDVTPFISSLKENTVSGYTLTSVLGGNTANSEFEFLTGNSMAWLSPNSVPYQQYTRSATYSMVSYLKKHYGYNCIAMHPYLASSWNRPEAYKSLGFDKTLFLDDFPQQDYVRSFISDREMFDVIIEEYEKNSDSPNFIFGVSMQNHGNYSYTKEDFTPSISLIGYEGSYPKEEQYLSLIHETDLAVEYLISYFSDVKDDVVIVFFGDHQPILSDDFYSKVATVGADVIEKKQLKYMVPFFVWANYDIEEKQIECTSLNYLSSYAFEVAGIPQPPYSQFLSEMEAVIPAINANGFYCTTKETFVGFDSATKEQRYWLDSYKQLQYNNMFDKKHRSEQLFPTID